ncbi:MAG TPA: 1-(5-phosphoribosyl)-5-amino-4-imidazole-carboxylate carboxylase, partial [Myxococcota bacterium]|nr:1-(5-phosphoribosyl)-5-amino-4-imidazole-carboxylate carboxylase [Myxococcota bacterium]
MEREGLRALLEQVKRGEVEPDAALEHLARLPFVDTPSARVDTHRALRCGLPEVVFGQGKSVAQVVEIARALRGAGHAATAFAALVGRPCRMRVPTVRLLRPDAAGSAFVASSRD